MDKFLLGLARDRLFSELTQSADDLAHLFQVSLAVWAHGEMLLADAPYTVLKGAVYTHPTLAEGFWTLMEDVKPVA